MGSRVWSFSHFEFHEHSLELRRGGEVIPVETKARQVLGYMLSQGLSKVLSPDEIREGVWGGTFVSNSSVNVAVNKLRDAFGDENRESVLRTVRGSGYAWAVEVVEVPSEPDQGQERAGLTLGDMVPGRMDWRLMQKLYADKDREVWLSGEIGGAGQRVVQVGWTEIGRELLQAEAEAYEALVDVCGVGVDGVGRWFTAECVARLGEAPYVLETEYLGLTLPAWAARQGGLTAVTESLRVKIVAAVASAVDRLHTAGWCHGKLGSECVHLQKTGEEWVARVDGSGHYRSEGAAGAAAQDGIGGGGGWVARKLAGAPRAQEELFEAPELKKWKGEIATPRGDLYALGVLLYQCVACNLTEAPMLGWEQRVEDGVLRSDIAETAHFDPEHRTRRPAELARDLGTLASRRQQEEKLARDRDAAQAAERKLAVEQGKKPLRLALVLAMVIATLVVATMGAVEIASLRRERDRAREEKSEEQAVKLFIARLLFEGDALPPGPITPEQMAERGVRMSQALEGVPEMHAAVLNLLGTGLGSLGRNERAEQVLGEALAERKRTKGAASPEVAETLVALAGVKEEESDPGAGLNLATQALAIETRALSADDVALARTRTQIAEDLIALGRGQEAMPMLEGVVAREKGQSSPLAGSQPRAGAPGRPLHGADGPWQ